MLQSLTLYIYSLKFIKCSLQLGPCPSLTKSVAKVAATALLAQGLNLVSCLVLSDGSSVFTLTSPPSTASTLVVK